MDIRNIALNMYSDLRIFSKLVKRGFARQDRINVYLWCALVGCVIHSELRRKEQDEKIEELIEEIKELKNTEGE